MDLELEDFLRHCRLERRLADLTCSAYERDVRACLAFLTRSEIGSLGGVTTPILRAFLADEAVRRPAASSQARTVAAPRCPHIRAAERTHHATCGQGRRWTWLHGSARVQ